MESKDRIKTVDEIIDIFTHIRVEKIEDEIKFSTAEVASLVQEIKTLRDVAEHPKNMYVGLEE